MLLPLVVLCVVPSIRLEFTDAPGRTEQIYRERFNLSGEHRELLAPEVPAAPAVPAVHGGTFGTAWRNYVKSIFRKGFMYRLSCRPTVILYIAENKTLAGREDRNYEGEALGRKMAVVFFEELPDGLVRRVSRETLAMNQQLLSIAETLQTIGGIAIPPDPGRTAGQTELLLEAAYEHLEVERFVCTVEPAHPEAHVFSLSEGVNAEAAFFLELPADQRTKMVLARALQRHDELQPEETLQVAWNGSLANLKARTAHLLPAPAVAAAPAAPPPPPAPAAPAAPPAPAPPLGRGRGGRGRGRGAAPAGRGGAPGGRGRGRARGRG